MIYVNNLFAINYDQKTIMYSYSIYNLKDTVSPPDCYLGANVGKWQLSDGKHFLWINGRYYIENVISLAKKLL